MPDTASPTVSHHPPPDAIAKEEQAAADVAVPSEPPTSSRRSSESLTRRASTANDPNKKGSTAQPKRTRWDDVKAHLVDVIKYGPLLAAVFAPVSTLLSIPGLTQPWFVLAGQSAPDPGSSRVLSAVSFVTNVIANVLLVARFTVSERRWRLVSIVSIVCWWINIIFAVVNLSYYGNLSRSPPGCTYDEGFWCTVGSVCVGGLVTLILSLHYLLRFDKPSSEGALIRVAGAEFIFTVSAFVGLMALEGFIFSEIERWTFFQGIYFSLVTAFTIGFGDFEPVKAASRVILFPFAALSIALLTVQIGVLVDFISSATAERHSRWHSRQKHAARPDDKTQALVEEISDLQHREAKQHMREALVNLGTSSISLAVFWLVGGAVFMAIEDWAFGTSMYFCYVFFLTIGYGDFSPETAGGRVFFVIYALMAVPVVTNFVLNTVTSLLSTIASRRYQKSRDRRAPTTAERRTFHSHAHNVERSFKRLENHFEDSQPVQEREEDLARVLLGLALRLEAQATTLLIGTLSDDNKGKVLLRADRNLQRRALMHFEDSGEKDAAHHGHDYLTLGTLALEKEMQDELKDSEDVASKSLDPTTGETDTLELIRRYRETFGGLLAAGSMLMKLEGDSRLRFERRLENEAKMDAGGMLLGSGRKGPAEQEYGVDV